MVINYLHVEAAYAKRGKVNQSMKLSEWANNEFKNISTNNNFGVNYGRNDKENYKTI